MEASTISPKPRTFGQEHFEIDRAVAALARLGAESSFWLALATDPELTDHVYEVFLASKRCTTPSKAARIMGVNMHGLGAARRHFEREVEGEPFKLVRYSAETLEAHRDTHVLVAVTALSVDDIEAIAPKWGYKPGSGVYPGHSWMFLADAKNAAVRPETGWYLIRKKAVGLGKTHDKARKLLGSHEYVPSLAVLAQAMILHFRETGEFLYYHTHVWASDVAPPRYTHGEIPSSIYFGENGLIVDVWSGEQHEIHGLSSAIKREVE